MYSGTLQCGWAGNFAVFRSKNIEELVNCLATTFNSRACLQSLYCIQAMYGTEISHLTTDITHNHASYLAIFATAKQASLIQSFTQ